MTSGLAEAGLERKTRPSSMAATVAAASRWWATPSFGLAFGILAALTVVRLIGLKLSVVDLFYDESQYWSWSRDLAFGYFSKPPLLPWIIAIADHICGDSEACVRAPSPILYFGTSLFVYGIARALYDIRVAFFASLSFGLATGVVFSARIISTDVPLVFFWALALLAFVKLLDRGGWPWAVLLGVALGFGLLAKYEMAYFLASMALAAGLDRGARTLFRTPQPWLAIAIAVVFLAPNVLWNVDNGFRTFDHTSHYVTGHGLQFDIMQPLVFLGGQFGVCGPILFAVILLAMARIATPAINRADRLMLAFAIPALALVTAVAPFTTIVGPNWAAPALVSGIIVAVALLVRRKAWRWLATSIACGAVLQVLLLAGDVMATRLRIPFLAHGDVYARTLGWRSLAEQVGALAQREGARTIVGDHRYSVASLLYYWRDKPQQILAWLPPWENFQLTPLFTAAAPQPMIFVGEGDIGDTLATCFASVQQFAPIDATTGPTSSRRYYVYKLEGPRGPIGALVPCR